MNYQIVAKKKNTKPTAAGVTTNKSKLQHLFVEQLQDQTLIVKDSTGTATAWSYYVQQP
jgi:hypothetical protein